MIMFDVRDEFLELGGMLELLCGFFVDDPAVVGEEQAARFSSDFGTEKVD